jgi:hypothetical protein
MRKFVLSAALAAIAAAAVSAAATRAFVAGESRAEQEHLIHQVRADNVAIRLELDALRRELMRRPIPPAKGQGLPDPDRIPPQAFPTTPKE